jgi:hypothetical protein
VDNLALHYAYRTTVIAGIHTDVHSASGAYQIRQYQASVLVFVFQLAFVTSVLLLFLLLMDLL